MWAPRVYLAGAFKSVCPVQSLEGVVVPTARIPDLIRQLEHLREKDTALIPCYGHAGDGNLHATPVNKAETSLETWRNELPLILAVRCGIVFDLGGTISGEHGIGSKRASCPPIVMNSEQIALQKQFKKVFDPLNMLNPGKVFPERDEEKAGCLQSRMAIRVFHDA